MSTRGTLVVNGKEYYITHDAYNSHVLPLLTKFMRGKLSWGGLERSMNLRHGGGPTEKIFNEYSYDANSHSGLLVYTDEIGNVNIQHFNTPQQQFDNPISVKKYKRRV